MSLKVASGAIAAVAVISVANLHHIAPSDSESGVAGMSLPTSLAPARLESTLLTARELEAAGIGDAAASEGTLPSLPCAQVPIDALVSFVGRRFDLGFLEGASEYVASVPERDARRFMQELRRCVGTSAHTTGGGSGDTVSPLPLRISGADDAIGFQIHGTTSGFMVVPYTTAALAVRRGGVVLYLSAGSGSGGTASGTLTRFLEPAIAKVRRTAASIPGAP